MMGRQGGDQSQLFYLFNLEGRIPADHLLRRINPEVTQVVANLHAYRLYPYAYRYHVSGSLIGGIITEHRSARELSDTAAVQRWMEAHPRLATWPISSLLLPEHCDASVPPRP
jgi:hypothetical protein